MAAHPPLRCSVHLAELAGWTCTVCKRWLCPTCVAVGAVGELLGGFECCALCDGPVQRLMRRGPPAPFLARLSEAVWLPLGWMTPVVLCCAYLAFPLLSLPSTSVFGAVLGAVAALPFAVLCFGTMHGAAQGARRIEPLVLADLEGGVLRPAARGWALLVLGGVGIRLLPGSPGWLAWAVLGTGVLWLPGFVLGLALGRTVWRSALLVPLVMRTAGADYWVASGLGVALVGFAAWMAGGALEAVRDEYLPLAALLLTVGFLAALVAARVLGLFLAAQADALGYPLDDQEQAPVLPGAVPGGRRHPKLVPSAPRPGPIELDELADAERGVGAPVVQLVDALEQGLDSEVTAAFARMTSAERGRLEARTLLAVGRAASRNTEVQAARLAWEEVAARSDHPLAADALLALGELAAQLGEAEAAAAALQRLLDRHPDSHVADDARARLDALRVVRRPAG